MRYFLLLTLMAICSVSCSYECGKAKLSFVVEDSSLIQNDSMIVRKYEKGSAFTRLFDTVILGKGNSYRSMQGNAVEVHYQSSQDSPFTSNFDYEVVLPSSHTVFEVTDIVENYRTEKKSTRKDYCVNSIQSYVVDGRFIQDGGYDWTIYLAK